VVPAPQAHQLDARHWLNALGTREHLSHRSQLLVFVGFEFRAIQLPQLKCDQLLSRGAVDLGPPEISEGRGQLSHVIKGSPHRCRYLIKRTKGIDDGQMGGGIEQGVVFVLAVDLDQLGGEIFERARRGQLTIDESPAAPLGGHFPSNEEILTAMFKDGFDRG